MRVEGDMGKEAAGKSKNEVCYWVRGERQGQGIVAGIGWMLSKPRFLLPYARLYGASGWDSLICHPHVLNLWFPSRATILALRVLDELAKEVEETLRPIVFATFSGGAKACLYKIFEILQGRCKGVEIPPEKYSRVRTCMAGQIHDSSPVDFVSELGVQFVSSPVFRKSRKPSIVLSSAAKAGAMVLDALFLPEFEVQRADYWLTLQQSAHMGPILVLCSKNDELAPIHTIHKFVDVVHEMGGQVTLVVWDTSDHVGHLRKFPDEYRDAVSKFLVVATDFYTHRQGSSPPLPDAGTIAASETSSLGWSHGIDVFVRNSLDPQLTLPSPSKEDTETANNVSHGGEAVQQRGSHSGLPCNKRCAESQQARQQQVKAAAPNFGSSYRVSDLSRRLSKL